uniref:MADF domain-containing protein n=1 Tax=Ditylenchus dipsaci TaxID=166011 RepID=A0A915DJA9_9BILA
MDEIRSCSYKLVNMYHLRNYQYSAEEEAQIDDFGNEWKKSNGAEASLAKKVTADALRQKYVRMKREQFWKFYTVAHASCPVGHNTFTAAVPGTDYSVVCKLMDDYVCRSTETINPTTITSVANGAKAAVSSSSAPHIIETFNFPDDVAPTVSSLASASTANSDAEDVVTDDIPVELPPYTVAPTQEIVLEDAIDSNPEKIVDVVFATTMPSLASASTANSDKDDCITDDIPFELPSYTVALTQEHVLHDAIDSDPKEEKNADNKTKAVVDLNYEADELVGRVTQILEGELVPTLSNGHLMLVHRNKKSSTSSVAVREVLDQAKMVLMKYLDQDSPYLRIAAIGIADRDDQAVEAVPRWKNQPADCETCGQQQLVM